MTDFQRAHDQLERRMTIELTPEQVAAIVAIALPAPEPPTQTEAERLVELANRLPQEVLGSGERDRREGYFCASSVDDRLIGCHRLDGTRILHDPDEFHRWLLGVMAAYVGTEDCAKVERGTDGRYYWYVHASFTTGGSPDLLTAYAACCKAIAARRKGGE